MGNENNNCPSDHWSFRACQKAAAYQECRKPGFDQGPSSNNLSERAKTWMRRCVSLATGRRRGDGATAFPQAFAVSYDVTTRFGDLGIGGSRGMLPRGCI